AVAVAGQVARAVVRLDPRVVGGGAAADRQAHEGQGEDEEGERPNELTSTREDLVHGNSGCRDHLSAARGDGGLVCNACAGLALRQGRDSTHVHWIVGAPCRGRKDPSCLDLPSRVSAGFALFTAKGSSCGSARTTGAVEVPDAGARATYWSFGP